MSFPLEVLGPWGNSRNVYAYDLHASLQFVDLLYDVSRLSIGFREVIPELFMILFDGTNLANQLRLVVFSHHAQGVSTILSGCWGFLNHEQYIPGFSSFGNTASGQCIYLTGWSIQWLQPQHEHLPETELFFQVALSIKPTLHPWNLTVRPWKNGWLEDYWLLSFWELA